tara:strand:+ start:601 stop:795 length:195 start_codon:yes stop_codon:yes gene_type:complete
MGKYMNTYILRHIPSKPQMGIIHNSYGIFKVFKANTYEQAHLKAVKHCKKLNSKFVKLWQDNDW